MFQIKNKSKKLNTFKYNLYLNNALQTINNKKILNKIIKTL